jgi:hypothetical protein
VGLSCRSHFRPHEAVLAKCNTLYHEALQFLYRFIVILLHQDRFPYHHAFHRRSETIQIYLLIRVEMEAARYSHICMDEIRYYMHQIHSLVASQTRDNCTRNSWPFESRCHVTVKGENVRGLISWPGTTSTRRSVVAVAQLIAWKSSMQSGQPSDDRISLNHYAPFCLRLQQAHTRHSLNNQISRERQFRLFHCQRLTQTTGRLAANLISLFHNLFLAMELLFIFDLKTLSYDRLTEGIDSFLKRLLQSQ